MCSRYITKELPREVNARGRRQAALALKKKETQDVTKKKAAREVNFNFTTYKGHSLADYAYYVRSLGTTDNYRMQTVCSILRIYFTLILFSRRASLNTNVLRASFQGRLRKGTLFKSQNMYTANANFEGNRRWKLYSI